VSEEISSSYGKKLFLAYTHTTAWKIQAAVHTSPQHASFAA